MKTIVVSASLLALLCACGSPAPGAEDGEIAVPASVSQFSFHPDGTPRLRAGLWEMKQVDEDGETEIHQECLADGLDDQTRAVLVEPAGPNCTKTVDRKGGITVAGVCRQIGGVQTSTTFKITGSDTAFTARLKLGAAAPGQEAETTESIVHARWVGECVEPAA